MKIATWNVNSVRARCEQLLLFLQENEIDVMLLQEIKCQTEVFPKEIFKNIGYNCAVFGQKTYNGIAILSKYFIEDVQLGTAIFHEDSQARYIEAFINNFRIASVYVPNGGEIPGGESYCYKLKFLNILNDYIKSSVDCGKYIIGGDFNIALDDIDVYDPLAWEGRVCCTEPERDFLRKILSSGVVDVMRCFQSGAAYTWFSYRFSQFAKNHGLRLDYILTTKDVVAKSCHVSLKTRGQERPSDHAPVVAVF